ncbi:proteasome subunit alpha [Lentzea sp. BCCO 10_0856]|uniref:Proteasome subunit alpha n=1 Tax=Lentzea miocenica TaxID=3095431 RepID=A0ABU4THA4_9PSEU|nr:proteasome subunit alpha [Lentzea sp. BCCO 10_0856]MDX8037579.1 proteasome subunit alpha [Lentzea sp. BCCO 10_0856]
MTMPLYASAEQVMRDRSEYARKGIARGRSVIVLKYADGILFVAENPSSTLHKVSEIYDRIGFAAVGRYSEFENLRQAGIRFADVRGYQNDPRDVTSRSLANVYATTLGTYFTEQIKPFEVEICVAEVGDSSASDTLYRLTYDGSIVDEPQYIVMGGTVDAANTALKDAFADGLSLAEAVPVAVKALSAGSSSTSTAALSAASGSGLPELLPANKLEVAVLERARPRRAFRRIAGAALDSLMPSPTKGGQAVEDVELPGSEDESK